MKNFFIIFLFLSNIAFSQVQGVWSGTMLYDIRAKTIIGISRKTFQLFIQNNQVTGTMTGIDSTIIEGKFYEEESCTGMGGLGELTTVWIYEDGHYDINVKSPEFHCTKYEGGYGDPGRVNAAVKTKFPAYNLKALKGDNTETVDLAGLGTQTIYTNWDFYRVSDAVLIVTPENYSSWLPEPGKTELSKGNMMKISMKLEDGNGNVSKLKATSFKLTLSNTSKEPGITLNLPLKLSKQQLPDLRFIPHPLAESIKDDQSIEIKSKNGVDGEAYIASYDGGGWTTLKVTALLEDHTRITGHLLIATGDSDITIPERDPNSKIATSWLNANSNPKDNADEEFSFKNQNNGDGLSAYEEYRGFISEGKFKRLDPKKKEVGIRMKKNEMQVFDEGITTFEIASDINAIRFLDSEIPDTRELNLNFESAHIFDQFALKLELGDIPNALGQAFNAGGPRKTTVILIDTPAINNSYKTETVLASPDRLKYTLKEYISYTTAHEISHGCNAKHHGAGGKESDHEARRDCLVPDSIYDAHNLVENFRPISLMSVGSAGSPESGDIECLLCYYPYHTWAYSVGGDGDHIYHKVPALQLGRRLCDSPDGTGINALPYFFGNATVGRGDCIHQLNLKK
jgi:hypothetical protein